MDLVIRKDRENLLLGYRSMKGIGYTAYAAKHVQYGRTLGLGLEFWERYSG